MAMIEKLSEKLLSKNLEIQILAIRETAHLISTLTTFAVKGVKISSDPLLACDALYQIGPSITRILEDQLSDELSHEARLSISLLLLKFGSKRGVCYVIEELDNGGNLEFFAASTLAATGVVEAGDVLLKRLRILTQSSRFVPNTAPKFHTLLNALKILCISIPADIRLELLDPRVPKEIAGDLHAETL